MAHIRDDDCSQDGCTVEHRHYPTSTSYDERSMSSGSIVGDRHHLMPTITDRVSHSMHNIINGTLDLKRRKRKANPIPAENKDDSYWERRKRNNESAKRSREVRRVKEYQSNARLMYLEEENIKLRAEVNTLRDEIGKLRQMLHCNGCSNHS
ncbi:unnamed protein product [Oppiella nova]|uniref:BZIP domain-containing protein n=1 Tax=Oppiella nova TaxID=334625 RepID=A0A7R9MEE8_9ACAR|nr:unnamed protein product [Oppiella nova]CAG2175866.1 unnamed protein product [Oppiella nova]